MLLRWLRGHFERVVICFVLGAPQTLPRRTLAFSPRRYPNDGDSGRPDGGYSAEEYAEDIHQFVDTLGLGQIVMLASGRYCS